MQILTESDVYQTHCGSVPRLYADGVVGLGAKLAAAADVVAGKVIQFAVCDREPEGSAGPPVVREIITIGMGTGGDPAEGYKERAARFCGEGFKPDGAGSHSLIASWYPYCDDETAIAAALADTLARRSAWSFRLPNLEANTPAPLSR